MDLESSSLLSFSVFIHLYLRHSNGYGNRPVKVQIISSATDTAAGFIICTLLSPVMEVEGGRAEEWARGRRTERTPLLKNLGRYPRRKLQLLAVFSILNLFFQRFQSDRNPRISRIFEVGGYA